MASRLPLRSHLRVPRFLWLTLAVRKQLAMAEGLAGYSLNAGLVSKTFLTLSAWESQERLDAFARAMPHLDIMRRLRPHMDPTKFIFWQTAGATLPVSWNDAIARLSDR